MRDVGRMRVLLRGELDLATAPPLTESMRRLREQDEHVLLDLDQVAFIDMGGLRAVLTAVEHASADGWAFAVTNGSKPVRRLIAMIGLDGRLPIDWSSA